MNTTPKIHTHWDRLKIITLAVVDITGEIKLAVTRDETPGETAADIRAGSVTVEELMEATVADVASVNKVVVVNPNEPVLECLQVNSLPSTFSSFASSNFCCFLGGPSTGMCIYTL